MNKTDMSNPVQYTAYLRAYVAQRREISSDMPAEWRYGEMSGNEAEGGEENIPRSRSTGVRSVATEPGCFESPKNS